MLKKTPLYDIHQKLNARMVPFAGWEMPVQYKGVMEEHRCVREKVGLFDISHMGEIIIEGERAEEFINFITTNDIRRAVDGQCQYAVMCNDSGGCVDDVISYKYSTRKYLVVVNASNTEKDYNWMLSKNSFGVTIQNKSPDYCQLALQGPKAVDVMATILNQNLVDWKPFTFREINFLGSQSIVSRTGYTGEDGFEIYAPWNSAITLWEGLMKAGETFGIQPIGLGARDTLRLESSYSLYGHEITDEITPLEARLAWAVKLDKPDFVGQKPLQAQRESGVVRELIGLEMIEAGIAREQYVVESQGQAIGFVTSGTFSPTFNKSIAMALVKNNVTKLNDEFNVVIRDKRKKAKRVPLPFYKRK